MKINENTNFQTYHGKHFEFQKQRKFLQKLTQKKKQVTYLQRNSAVLPDFSSTTENARGQCIILLRTE